MPLNAVRMRVILRWVHIVIGLALLCYIYSPFGERYAAFRFFIKFIAVPVVVISGIWMWKSAVFNRLFKIK